MPPTTTLLIDSLPFSVNLFLENYSWFSYGSLFIFTHLISLQVLLCFDLFYIKRLGTLWDLLPNIVSIKLLGSWVERCCIFLRTYFWSNNTESKLIDVLAKFYTSKIFLMVGQLKTFGIFSKIMEIS